MIHHAALKRAASAIDGTFSAKCYRAFGLDVREVRNGDELELRAADGHRRAGWMSGVCYALRTD